MKKFISSLSILILVIMSISLASCGSKNKSTYTFVGGLPEKYTERLTVEFEKGTLTISFDSSGLNSNEVNNIAVGLTMNEMAPGKYEYTEKDGVYTTKEPMSPLSSNPVVFKSYFDGKYIVSSAFSSSEISTNSTNGLSDFSITTSLSGTLIFESNGKYKNDGNDEYSGTYTIENGLIQMYKDGEIVGTYLATGDGKCYSKYLLKND